MKLPSKKYLAILFLFIFSNIFTQILFAGRKPEYSDKYPKFTKIIQWNDDLYFLGTWANRYIALQMDKNNNWHIFTSVTSKYILDYSEIINIPDGCLLTSPMAENKLFYFSTKKWETVSFKSIESIYYSHREAEEDTILRKNIVIEENNQIKHYRLSEPSDNAMLRWRHFFGAYIWPDAEIGASVTINNTKWFTIDYYAGEGNSGIGGIGMFDYNTRKFGVIRDSLLVSCSKGLLVNKGDSLIIATSSSGEYGLYPDVGLVIADIKKGLMTAIPPIKNFIRNNYFLSMYLRNNILWMTTDESIVSWDLNTNKWKSFRIDFVVTNKKCSIYRRPIKYSNFSNGGLPTQIDFDKILPILELSKGDTLKYFWPTDSLAAVKSKYGISGWMKKNINDKLTMSSPDHEIQYYTMQVIYSDDSLNEPIHSFLGFSDLILEKETANAMQIRTDEAWIRLTDINPIISESFNGTISKVEWHSFLKPGNDVYKQALETMEIEQYEKKFKTTIVDTVLTFDDTMQPHEVFYNIPDAFWLPIEESDQPFHTGIFLVPHIELLLKDNKLEYNSKSISKGDNISVEEESFIYSYTILDYVIKDLPKSNLQKIVVRFTVKKKR